MVPSAQNPDRRLAPVLAALAQLGCTRTWVVDATVTGGTWRHPFDLMGFAFPSGKGEVILKVYRTSGGAAMGWEILGGLVPTLSPDVVLAALRQRVCPPKGVPLPAVVGGSPDGEEAPPRQLLLAEGKQLTVYTRSRMLTPQDIASIASR